MSGWLLAPFVVHHAALNRLIPSMDRAPISGLSPSELDYSFVSHTLSHPTTGVKATMALAYTVLVGAFAVHATYAVPALLRFAKRSSSSAASPAKRTRRRRLSRATISSSLAGILLASLLSVVPLRHTDRLTISASLKARYDAVLAYAWPTHFFFRTS
ncbi:hypothetical protein PHSY_007001 [Pseudozyma hubeiensis SY62]|uniref:Mitochondrial adapter protein MCP1 transmembrane domain-containing protein n=1 Tax=Pseudozyma hubeiensis (strain SY62) TaxID=1305764 RepID=R9PMS7_PSEHS|nr:hypothetical protein PHSY_007001 [Pseudozyma hubeiensis SY62]GAC99400.1 hypothetical protein PHSY_007001 [Pseudozyma hubeiensis SY62]